MMNRAVGRATTLTGALVAAILVGGQLLAEAGSGARDIAPAAPATSSPGANGCAEGDGEACGNQHAAAVQAWVRCKADKGKDACPKPDPPGKALGLTKRAGVAPGPAGSDGNGKAWGRAHAPGQLKKAGAGGASEPGS